MKEIDPLEQTQENLHPVIVAHRASHDEPAPGAGQPLSVPAVLLSAVMISGMVLVWLWFAAGG